MLRRGVPLLMMRDPWSEAGLKGFRSNGLTHASRYTQSLFQLARQGGDDHRCRLLGHQLRGLGNRRHFPRLRPFDGRQGRRDRDHDRPVPHALQRAVATNIAPARPPDHHGAGEVDGTGPAGDRSAGLRHAARRTRPQARPQPVRRRGRPGDHDRSLLPRPERAVRSVSLRAVDPLRPAIPRPASSPNGGGK